MVGTSVTPVTCIAIVGAAPSLPFHVPLNRRLGVDTPPLPTRARLEGPLPLLVPPVLLVAPCQTRMRRTTPAPRSAWLAPLFVPRLERLLTPHGRAVVAPSSDHRVERLDEASRWVHPMSVHHGPSLSLMTCHRLPARVDDGLVAALGRRGVVPNGAAQEVTAGLTCLDLQGVGEAGRARFPFQAQAASVVLQHRLTALAHVPLGRSGHQLLRLANHGRWAAAGQRLHDGRFPSVQGHVGS
jgi:hypothetical protein